MKNIKGSFGVAGTSMLVRASVKTVKQKTEVKLSGLCELYGNKPTNEISNIGMKNTIFQISFRKLMEVAKHIADTNAGIITYTIQ